MVTDIRGMRQKDCLGVKAHTRKEKKKTRKTILSTLSPTETLKTRDPLNYKSEVDGNNMYVQSKRSQFQNWKSSG